MKFIEREYENAEQEQRDIDRFKTGVTLATKGYQGFSKAVVVYALLELAAQISCENNDSLFIEAAHEVYDMALSGNGRIFNIKLNEGA